MIQPPIEYTADELLTARLSLVVHANDWSKVPKRHRAIIKADDAAQCRAAVLHRIGLSQSQKRKAMVLCAEAEFGCTETDLLLLVLSRVRQPLNPAKRIGPNEILRRAKAADLLPGDADYSFVSGSLRVTFGIKLSRDLYLYCRDRLTKCGACTLAEIDPAARKATVTPASAENYLDE